MKSDYANSKSLSHCRLFESISRIRSAEKQQFSCISHGLNWMNEWEFVVALVEWIYFRLWKWKSFQFTIKKLLGNVLHHGYGLCKTFEIAISVSTRIDPNHIIKPTFDDITTFEWMNDVNAMYKFNRIVQNDKIVTNIANSTNAINWVSLEFWIPIPNAKF